MWGGGLVREEGAGGSSLEEHELDIVLEKWTPEQLCSWQLADPATGRIIELKE